MVNVELNLPELPVEKLDNLRKGHVFMLRRDYYARTPFIYMVVKNNHENRVEAVCLQSGELNRFGSTTVVTELDVTLRCKIQDPDALPF